VTELAATLRKLEVRKIRLLLIHNVVHMGLSPLCHRRTQTFPGEGILVTIWQLSWQTKKRAKNKNTKE
jgi:hypothetical protein